MSAWDWAAEARAWLSMWRFRLRRRLRRHADTEKRLRVVERQLAALMRFMEIVAGEDARKEQAPEPAYVAAAAVAARRREFHLVSTGEGQR